MARIYVAGAAGALRHALGALHAEGRVPAPLADAGDFLMRRVGRSELMGSAMGWDAVNRCVLPDGSEGAVRALRPSADPENAIWLRPDTALPNLWSRGRIVLSSTGAAFVDEPDLDSRPVPGGHPDLGRDLLRSGMSDLSRRPALAAALEVTLASGSWCHLETGARWFADPYTARSLVRALGCSSTIDVETRLRLSMVVERGALAIIEALGWRHLPTPECDVTAA